MMSADQQLTLSGSMALKWDPKNLEIRTRSVEKTLEPLVIQVSFFNKTVIFEAWQENGMHVILWEKLGCEICIKK